MEKFEVTDAVQYLAEHRTAPEKASSSPNVNICNFQKTLGSSYSKSCLIIHLLFTGTKLTSKYFTDG